MAECCPITSIPPSWMLFGAKREPSSRSMRRFREPPVGDGRLQLGTWQGIYLGEHPDYGGRRSVVVTLDGEGY
ncbi:MAG: YjbQ family protein [Methylococcaceae bacterium]|nr:YjbQ family protein [Methylococcaceae bacterium]